MDFNKFSRLIMIEQTLFALPFALVGVLFGGGGTFMTWIWVSIALAAARTAGMSFNRVIDADIDAKNPRTRDRLVPKGEVRPESVWLIAVVSSVILVFASLMLNMLCFYISFAAIALLFTYSYFKRFSASSHFYLGFVEAVAPLTGYLAATGSFSPIPFILGLVIMTWIAGLDIVYAIQDMDFDKRENLHSIPAMLGKENALAISALCYVLSIISMAAAGIVAGMGIPYWCALVVIGGIFTYQQKLARNDNIAESIKSFFKINMFVSPVLFLGTFLDVFLP